MLKEAELRKDLGVMHDIIVDAWELNWHVNFTDEYLWDVFNQLPEHIQDIAWQWGLSDTVFKDEAFVFLRDKT